ncbi:MAG: hypothetical protein JW944_11215 [Deltaproteobacteria bacterium]|nr:hypothetical protein [Deltaproteobacteria bacterium]
MKIKLSMINFALISTLMLILFGCGSDSYYINPAAGEKTYTAYNMWYELGKEDAMWAINYKTGIMIPAGTEVSSIMVKESQIYFVTVDDKRRYTVNFNAKFHPGKRPTDYARMMFSEKDFLELTKGMSQTDIDGINEGLIMVGMTKKAVIVAYGYPPEHKTPDLNGNVWRYWLNRFSSTEINFDDDGKTIKPAE